MMAYKSPMQLADDLDKSIRSVRGIIAEIRAEICAGRYPPESVLDGCGVLVNELVVYDYLYYRRYLKNVLTQRAVPPYSAGKWKRLIGEGRDAE